MTHQRFAFARKLAVERLETREVFSASSLTLTSWANGATVDGSNTWDTLVLQQDTNFTLRSGSVTSGGKTLYYRNFENLKIVGGASANQFTLLPGFDNKISGTLSLDAGGGSDTLNLGGTQGLNRDVKLYQSPHPSLQYPSTLEIDRRVIKFSSSSELPENLSIRGTDQDNIYKIVNYSGAVKIDGAGGVDSVTLGGNAADIKLFLSASSNRVEMGASKNRLFNLERLQVEGGSANQTFEVQGNAENWESVKIIGGDGKDTVSTTLSTTVAFLTSDALYRLDHRRLDLQEVESVRIIGNELNQELTVYDWRGEVYFDGRGGGNSIVKSFDLTGFATINDHSIDLGYAIFPGLGRIPNQISFQSINQIAIMCGDGEDWIDGRQFPGVFFVDGGGGNDIIFGSMSNINGIYGGSGDDLIVGGDKEDVLSGDDGRDIVIGGRGADDLAGGDGQDIIIGGTTSYLDKGLGFALGAIPFFWSNDSQKFGAADANGIPNSGRIYSVFHDGVSISRSGTKYYLRTAVPGSTLPATVFDDGAVDTVADYSRDEAADWYFLNLAGSASAKDVFFDENIGNVVTEL